MTDKHKCPVCGAEYGDIFDAEECCTFPCPECGELYFTKAEADLCCAQNVNDYHVDRARDKELGI